jgi:hypothetical protein
VCVGNVTAPGPEARVNPGLADAEFLGEMTLPSSVEMSSDAPRIRPACTAGHCL